MELEQAQQLYESFGGNPDDLADIHESDLEYMVSIQQRIHEISNNYHEEQMSIEEELESLNLQLAEQELSTDSYREIQNQIILKENKIRESLGMEEKPLYILDSELLKLLTLDSYKSMGKNCQEYLSNIDDKYHRQDIQKRLESLSTNIQSEIERDNRESAFLLWASSTLAELKTIPIPWIMKDGEILENPAYKQWFIEATSLKSNLEKKIKYYESIQTNLGIKTDKKNSVFRMYDKICNLLEKGSDSNGN